MKIWTAIGIGALLVVLVSNVRIIDARRIASTDAVQYLRTAREVQRTSVDRAIGCKAPPTAWMFQFLNRICEDCFELYRDTDLYHMCRSDCFGSDYFRGCMDVLLVESEDRRRAANLVHDIHHYV